MCGTSSFHFLLRPGFGGLCCQGRKWALIPASRSDSLAGESGKPGSSESADRRNVLSRVHRHHLCVISRGQDISSSRGSVVLIHADHLHVFLMLPGTPFHVHLGLTSSPPLSRLRWTSLSLRRPRVYSARLLHSWVFRPQILHHAKCSQRNNAHGAAARWEEVPWQRRRGRFGSLLWPRRWPHTRSHGRGSRGRLWNFLWARRLRGLQSSRGRRFFVRGGAFWSQERLRGHVVGILRRSVCIGVYCAER